jgi:hypothetical protein
LGVACTAEGVSKFACGEEASASDVGVGPASVEGGWVEVADIGVVVEWVESEGKEATGRFPFGAVPA